VARTPYDAVLEAAGELPGVDTALAAEMFGAALLGSVYAVAEGERADVVRDFVTGFLRHTARRRTPAARVARTVFASLLPEAGKVRTSAEGLPPWLGQVGRVRLVGSWAYGDAYGDQTSYLASFAYEQPELGGAEHAVVVLIDHNIGIVKDLFVGEPADRLLQEVRRAAATDELVWLSEVDPATMRAQVEAHLAVTDGLSVLPDGGAMATDRMLAGARLTLLPPGTVASLHRVEPDPGWVDEFLASVPAKALDRTGEREASLQYAVRLILDFAQDAPDSDPLRWSPAVVGLFLLDWVHRRAVLDADDVAVLPEVLRAWVVWAGQRRGLPPAAIAGTEEAIDVMAEEFTRLYTSGERRDPAVTAVTRLLADGIDPGDEAAVRDWLAAHPDAAEPPDPQNGSGGRVPRPR
jgi:hypothetical protein